MIEQSKILNFKIYILVNRITLRNNILNYLLDVYGSLEAKTIYKCFVCYVLKIFSKYLKENNSDLLKELHSILQVQNLFSYTVPFQFAITKDFMRTCLKKVICFFLCCFQLHK